MDDKVPSDGLVLYIWPGLWDLPSFEPLCLAAVLYLQLAIPNKFRVVETANPDTSPSGQLPYLVHNQHIVTSLSSILKYVSDLRHADHSIFPHANLDLHLTPTQKSQRTAWFAHTESKLGDLVAFNLFAVQWREMTGPKLASMYPIPQRYYVPRRIQEDYYPRLVASGMSSAPVEVEEEPDHGELRFKKMAGLGAAKRKDGKIAKAFEREKALSKAKAELDIYQSLLSDKRYIFGEQPTSLDVVIASHLLLLLKPPTTQTPSLKSILIQSYPTLASYSQRVYDLAFATGTLDIRFASMSISLGAILPTTLPRGHKEKKKPTAKDVHFKRMRWGFFGLVAGAFAAYLAVVWRGVEIQWVEADSADGEEDGKDEEMRQEKETQKSMDTDDTIIHSL